MSCRIHRSCGVIEAEIISPEQASELCPILKTDDLAVSLITVCTVLLKPSYRISSNLLDSKK